MGVIAVAVFAENKPKITPKNKPQVREQKNSGQRMDSAGAPSAAAESALSGAAKSAPGTGYGETHYSEVETVEFVPYKKPLEKILVKYEWRETLCKKNILNCSRKNYEKPNRLWDGDRRDFAPEPPTPFYR